MTRDDADHHLFKWIGAALALTLGSPTAPPSRCTSHWLSHGYCRTSAMRRSVGTGMNDDELQIVVNLRRQIEALKQENDRLTEILGLKSSGSPKDPVADQGVPSEFETPLLLVDRTSSPESKVAFFRSIFVGRDDVYALRWESGTTGKHGWSPAVVGGFANARSTGKEYLPLTSSVIADHLAGKIHAGLYPLLRDDSCRLIVCDFDGPGWALDAFAPVGLVGLVGPVGRPGLDPGTLGLKVTF